MSEAKIDDENIRTQSLNGGDKEDEAQNNSVSDGEIIDDDEPAEQKPALFPHRKINKNFRLRHGKSDDSDEAESKSGKTSPKTFEPIDSTAYVRLQKSRRE